MNEQTLEVMPVNMLWALRERIDATLVSRLLLEKNKLEQRIAQLSGAQHKFRRPYPQVHPKYFNPENPSQTWSGRGLRPHWFTAQIGKGYSADDLRIPSGAVAA